MSLIVNGTTIGKLIVNSVEVKKLVVNGTEVYKVNETLAKPAQYLLGSPDDVYAQMYDTDSVLDFGLLAYDSMAINDASNAIFSQAAYRGTFIWDMDSINMFYNTDRAVWAHGSQEELYNSNTEYKTPIGFFKPEDTHTFVTTYDNAMTQTVDSSLPDNMQLCFGPALKYTLRQKQELFGIPYENKENAMASLGDNIASFASSNALGIEYIPTNLSDALLTDIMQKITAISQRIAEEAMGGNFITWFIQSPGDEPWWENFYQMLTPALESVFGSNGVWFMPYDALTDQNKWDRYFTRLVQDRFDTGARVMIIPLTTTKHAERYGWVWDTPASTFALELLENIRSYDDSTYNGLPIANGIIVLDDIETGIKKQLGLILDTWKGLWGESIQSEIYLMDSLNYVIYGIFNDMTHPSCVAIDRFNMEDDMLLNESIDMIINNFDQIILSYGLHYLVTCYRNGLLGTQPLTELIISKEKEKCNATGLTDTEFLDKLSGLADRLEEINVEIIPLYSNGDGLLYGKA